MKDASRARYLDALAEAYRSLALPLLTPTATLPLGAVFQPLRLRHDPLAADDLAQERRRKLLRSDGAATPGAGHAGGGADEPATSPVVANDSNDALAKSPTRRLVILGGPGAGKTTTLKHLLASAIQRARDSSAEAAPIFIAAPDLARSGVALSAYLERQALSLGVASDDAASLWQAIQGGQAFVCIDSLDEVAPAQRAALIAQINDWAREPGNTWVIGSRFTEYKGGQFAHARFAEWELEPLGHDQRLELARRLLPILGEQLHGGRADAPRLSPSAFVAALETRPEAKVWRDNPLLVSLAAVVFSRRGALPQNQALLLREAGDAILATREPEAARREELWRALAEVALRLYSGAGRVFTRDDVLTTLTNIRQEQRAEWSPDDLTQRIIASGALDVISPTHETYAFFHQSFQEYLAAVALARRLTSEDEAQREAAWEFAWSRRLYSRWTEVLRLLAPVLTHENAADGPAVALRWLRALLGQRDTAEGDVGDLGLSLAVVTLAIDEGVADTQTAAIAAWRELRMEALGVWIALMSEAVRAKRFPRQRRLMALSDDLGRVVAQVEQSAPRTPDAAMQRLIEPLTALLASNDQFVSPHAMEALIPFGAYAPLSSLVALASAKTRSHGDASRGPYQHMEEAELLGRMDHPGIHQALRDLLGSDDDGDRAVAVVALGNRGALVQPDDVARLIGALGDPSLYVRMRTIRVLGAARPWLSSAQTEAATDALVALATDPTAGASASQVVPRWVGNDEARAKFRQEQSATIMLFAMQALSQLNPASLARIPLEPSIALLDSQNGEIRLLAVRMLSQFGERAPYELLATTLCAEEWVLGDDNPSRGAMLFMAPQFTAGATELGQLGERIPIEPMIRLLRHPHPHARSFALKALDEAQGRAPVELIRAAIESSYPDARQAAVGLLARSKHKGALPIMRVELTEPEGGDTSGQSQSRFGRQRLNRLQPPNGIERLTIPARVQTLLRPSRYDMAGWAEIVLHLPDGRDERLCEAMVGVLELSGAFTTPDGVATLEALLNDPIRKLRPRALAALGDAGASAPVATLLDALATTTSETLWQGAAAIAALGAVGTDEAIAALLPIARCGPDDPQADLRPNALAALGKACPHPSPQIAALEIDGMRSDDDDVSDAAIEAIKRWQSIPALNDEDLLLLTMRALNVDVVYEDEETAESVGGMYERILAAVASGPHISQLNDVAIHDPDERRRTAALGCLGRMNAPRSLATLFAALDDAESWVRYRAMEALITRYERTPDEHLRERLIAEGTRILAEERQKPQLSERQQMCANLAADLVRLGAPTLTETVADLSSMLIGDHPWLPNVAFILLCDLGEHAPVDLLADWFRRYVRETPSDDAVTAKIETLSRLGERTPYALFAELLTGELPLASVAEPRTPYALIAALRALEALGPRAPLAPFLAAAQHADENVRAKEIEALGELFPQESEAIILAAFDGQPEDVVAAAKASRHLGAQAPVARLRALLGGSDRSVRQAAVETLVVIAPDTLAAVQREAMDILLGAPIGDIFGALRDTALAHRLGSAQRSYPTLLAKLAELLEAPYWETQVAAASALGGIRRNIPDRAIRRLLELRRGSQSPTVRNAAEDALAEILTIESGLEDDRGVS